MKRFIISLMLLILVSSCVNGSKEGQDRRGNLLEKITLSKLEQLMQLSTDSVIPFFDLSDDSITVFPDLSAYTICSLDMSYNQLDSVLVEYMPKGIEAIDLSHNNICGSFYLGFRVDEKNIHASFDSIVAKNNYHSLKVLDLSYNRIDTLMISFALRKIIVAHNDLKYIHFNHGNIKYVDVSYNPLLSNIVNFDPSKIDTILRDGILNNDDLRYSLYEPFIDSHEIFDR